LTVNQKRPKQAKTNMTFKDKPTFVWNLLDFYPYLIGLEMMRVKVILSTNHISVKV